MAYAAAAGTTAADGRGRNGPYTSALLAYLQEPLELSAVFRRVRARVLESTDGQQRPHEYGSLLREHYLSGLSGPVPVAVAAADGAAARLQQETVFWQSILGSRNAADFEAYLGQFPDGVYRTLATNRLAELRAAAGDAEPSPAGQPSRGRYSAIARAVPRWWWWRRAVFAWGCVSGIRCFDSRLPVHEVSLPSFALSKYEVTFDEYDRFARDTGRRRPDDHAWGRGRRPVILR